MKVRVPTRIDVSNGGELLIRAQLQPKEILLDTAGKVVSIHRMEPYVMRGTTSKAEAKYAIELNAGQADAAKVKQGDDISLPDKIKSADADP